MGSLRRSGARLGGRRLSDPSGGHRDGSAGPRDGTWRVRYVRGSAAALVATDDREGSAPERSVVICSPDEPALVLGSTQDDAVVDRSGLSRLGAAVVRRRSGGGAVFVEPDSQVWLDCFLPALDPLLEHDVSRSFAWLGHVFAGALADVLGPDGGEIAVNGPRLVPSAWSRLACFAGLGAGEVTLSGRKVVGISQRRTRSGAWFHCVAPLRQTNAQLVACLRLSENDRAAAAAYLATTTTVVDATAGALVGALVSRLP